jgi:hypothetical protein
VTQARPAAGLDWVRQDIHIHTTGVELVRRLAEVGTYAEWLPHHFRDYAVTADHGLITFALALPLRTESARLYRDPNEREAIALIATGESDVASITWAFHEEGARDVHLTGEVRYRRANGPFAPLLEVMLHRPYRTQALRESLWNLKQIVEGRNGGS